MILQPEALAAVTMVIVTKSKHARHTGAVESGAELIRYEWPCVDPRRLVDTCAVACHKMGSAIGQFFSDFENARRIFADCDGGVLSTSLLNEKGDVLKQYEKKTKEMGMDVGDSGV